MPTAAAGGYNFHAVTGSDGRIYVESIIRDFPVNHFSSYAKVGPEIVAPGSLVQLDQDDDPDGDVVT
jgi:hypothetical protein